MLGGCTQDVVMRTRILPYVYDSVSVSEASEFNDLRVEGPRGAREVGWKSERDD